MALAKTSEVPVDLPGAQVEKSDVRLKIPNVRVRGKRPFFQYSTENMDKAIRAVQEGVMTFALASKMFRVPRVTLMRKVKDGKTAKRQMGPRTVLATEQEIELVKWISDIGKLGFPLFKVDLLCSVKKIMDDSGRTGLFRDGKPGKKWYEAFHRRHPELRGLMSELLTASKVNVSEKQVRTWFSATKSYFSDNNLLDILSDRKRVFNCDESLFNLCTKSGEVLSVKGEHNILHLINCSGKEVLTALVSAGADGTVTPPFILFPYERIPSGVNKNGHEEGLSKGECGWMTAETFHEYICDVFYPWLEQRQAKMPVVLFMDGHKSHLTMHLCKFCSEKGIILVALLPNAGHIIQPCYASIFQPMKIFWKDIVQKWQSDHPFEPITKHNFAQLFNGVIASVSTETISNAFESTGIFPFNANSVDYRKCAPSKVETSVDSPTTSGITEEEIGGHLKHLESIIPSSKLFKFKQCYNATNIWEGEECSRDLYEVWAQMKYNISKDSSYAQSVSSISLNLENSSPQAGPSDVCYDDINEIANMCT